MLLSGLVATFIPRAELMAEQQPLVHAPEFPDGMQGLNTDEPLSIPFAAMSGEPQAMLEVDLMFYFCREDDTGVCTIQSVRWNVPLQTVDEAAKTEPGISYRAEPPKVNKQL
jgi:hypothetical protein